MLQLGYETLRRRSELVTFRFRDLARTPAGTYRIRLFRSKTDQFGQGLQLPVSLTLVTMIQQWQERAGSHTDFILPAINADGVIVNEPLADAKVNKILRARQQDAGLELEAPLSGHSFRVGGALDLLKRGVPMEKIMLRGGWKSESTALRYLREWVGDDMLVWDDT
jgi:integrase